MPGSATANVLQRSPRDLALRAALAFGGALGLFAWLGPSLLEPLLRYYETVVYALDDRYWITFSLTHQTGHGKIGSDWVVLGQASVMKALAIHSGDTVVALKPGQALTCSTAIGVLMQPAIMIVGILLAWPARSSAAVPGRVVAGSLTLGGWFFFGIPLLLWLYFQDIPIRVVAPNIIPLETVVGRFLLNGGGLVVGSLLAAAALAGAACWPRGAKRPRRFS